MNEQDVNPSSDSVRETEYMSDEDAAKFGSYPDEPSPEETQQHSENSDTVIGSAAVVVEGIPYERKTGEITVNGEKVELPSEIAQTAQKMGMGLDGQLHAQPATNSERGGGLEVITKPEAQAQLMEKLPRSHKKSSHRRLDLT